ncbi:MAG: PepSY-associated TM helix domain-containing protein [Bacteroidales bacterium]|nr:PepSY-associated TM helix domain-containing protein [Bacteroidales bacterium]
MQVKTLRRWNNVLHRDIGYLCVGMTIIYAISGIVLNHFKSGDFQHPDYGKSYTDLKVPLPKAGVVDQTYVWSVLDQVGQRDNFKSFITGDGYVQIFLTKGFVYVDLATGEAEMERKTTRHVIKEMNLLHYNNPKKLYTWFSDLYAAALIILAITGLFVLRGKKGILGRGAWLTAIGIILPALFLLFYL